MHSFTKKKIGTLTLGEKLKKSRLERRISISEVSRLTRIQIKYLEYLEEGDYEKLPADVYVRGFIRSYAEFLGLDESVPLKLYEKEREIKRNIKKVEKNSDYSSKKDQIKISAFVFTPKKIVLSLLVAGFFLGGFFLYREIGSFTNEPRLVVLGPKNNSETKENFTDVFGVTDRDARIFINDQAVLVGDDGKFKESVTLQPGINAINIKALNRFDKESLEQIAIKADMDERFGNGGEENDVRVAEENNELKMELYVDPGPVWVSVEADGILVFSGTMLSGGVQSFKAKDKIVISSGKANATFLRVNSSEAKKLGEEPGAVRGVTFDQNTKF
jgi:hypothetical protein